ncbi:hypothetical protein BHYA_0154g00010 [Botrytis hyacinthi]|uniref:Uncharacterized protein n=1 Tax=Botrytis hyacinthi TaxID=278943 RepID=A0A4Z1GJZ4_9HELO|nr:hypothetical protein BHYA_0154g00010 [Botrytis hyacinthi]
MKKMRRPTRQVIFAEPRGYLHSGNLVVEINGIDNTSLPIVLCAWKHHGSYQSTRSERTKPVGLKA